MTVRRTSEYYAARDAFYHALARYVTAHDELAAHLRVNAAPTAAADARDAIEVELWDIAFEAGRRSLSEKGVGSV